MTVSELTAHLDRLPRGAEVRIFWDGGERGVIEGIVDCDRRGVVVLVTDWSIYRNGAWRVYPEDEIVHG